MKHAIAIVVALVGLAASAPAQFRIEGRLGRRVEVGVEFGGPRTPVQRGPAIVTAHYGHDDHGRDRGGEHRGRDERRGHWETVCEQVFVPGYFREEAIPARYGWIVDHCGHRHWGIVEPAGCRRVWVPGHYETRHRQVWVRC